MEHLQDQDSDGEDDPSRLLDHWLGELNTLGKVTCLHLYTFLHLHPQVHLHLHLHPPPRALMEGVLEGPTCWPHGLC